VQKKYSIKILNNAFEENLKDVYLFMTNKNDSFKKMMINPLKCSLEAD